MKAKATPSNGQDGLDSAKPYRSHAYHKVLDGRKPPVRGLWRRGQHFVARLP
jgi:hypothetical protein